MRITKEKLSVMLTAIAEVFNRELSTAAYQVYWLALSDISLEQLEKSFAAAVRTCKFMPTPAEIRSLSSDTGTASPEDLAMLAFSAVDNAVMKIGGYKSVSFDDPVVNATIRALGGWVAICDKSQSDFNTFFRADFIKQYAAFHRAGVNGEITGPLPGITDQENLLAGYNQGTLKLIPCGTASKNVRRIDGRPKNDGTLRIECKPTSGRQNSEPKTIRSILEERALAPTPNDQTSQELVVDSTRHV